MKTLQQNHAICRIAVLATFKQLGSARVRGHHSIFRHVQKAILILKSLLLASCTVLVVACNTKPVEFENAVSIKIKDLKTGNPLAGVSVWESRELSWWEKWLRQNLIKFPNYVKERTDEDGITSFRLSNPLGYWITTKYPGSKIIMINENKIFARCEDAKIDPVYMIGIKEGTLIAQEDGTFQINPEKFELLKKQKKSYILATKKNILSYHYFISNDGKGNFKLESSILKVARPEEPIRTSPVFLYWDVNSSPESKEILVGIDLEKPLRLTGVEFEPEGIFYVEKIRPLSSEDEAKKFGYLHMRGIKNQYIVTIRPKTTAQKAEIELVKFRTDPPLPNKIGDPYLGYLHIMIKSRESFQLPSKRN